MARFLQLLHSLLLVAFNTLLILLISNSQLCLCGNLTTLSCIKGEREALLKIKRSLVDPSNLLRSWEAGEDFDCCKWKGVGCDSASAHVVKLEILGPQLDPDGQTEFFLAYEVSPYLLKLKYLNHLDLSGIRLANATFIPKFIGSMKQLQYLNLSQVNFRGPVPHHLGNLTSLEVLHLGNLPLLYDSLFVDDVKWVSHLVALKYLDMSGVNLFRIDNLMQVLAMLPNSLSYLALSYCNLHNSPLPHGRVIISNSTFLANLQFLDLSWNHLEGQIPSALQNMTLLQYLDLSNNLFNGSVPAWFDNFKSLVYLGLSWNEFERIEGGHLHDLIRDKCYLRHFDLSYNNFQGEIAAGHGNSSSSFCTASNLEFLDAFYNNFSGSIRPDWLQHLKSLRYLSLSGNSLSGPIPSIMGTLSSLRALLLSDNQLEGVISEVHFANLSQLKVLDISFNPLAIQLESTWVPPFQLYIIEMGSCKFGTQFPLWIQTQKDARVLDLSNASISGDLPEWLHTCARWEEVRLAHNSISGMVGEFYSAMLVDLSYNLLTSLAWKFSPDIFSLDLSHNQISGVIPFDIAKQMPSLNELFLNDNQITGSIPPSLCNLTTYSVVLARNKLSGDIPKCWRNPGNFYLINLSSNNLSGPIPSSMGNLQLLQSLHMNNNNLQGKIPDTLRFLGKLKFLDLGENNLSGNVPTWIGENLRSLQRLRLRDNRISGSLPTEICSLLKLQILDLAMNNLRGNIPWCIGYMNGMTRGSSLSKMRLRPAQAPNLAPSPSMVGEPPPVPGPPTILPAGASEEEKMKEVMKGAELEYTTNLNLVVTLDLSCNNFVGSVPKDLTLLTGLVSLNLSHNLLSGNIPYNIGNMKNLESLDFSNNELSGTIPSSISALTFLSHLNLSNNHLQGRILKGNQLDTIYSSDHSIYDGNPQLCGESLSKQCPGDGQPLQPPPNKQDEDQQDASDKLILYIVVMLGFGVGFWGVIGALMFKKTWRAAYFRLIEDAMDTAYVYVKLKVTKLKRRMRSA